MCISVPFYNKAYWPEPSKRSLSIKLIASTLFLAIAALCIVIKNNQSEYAQFMLIGLLLGWIGDILMHIPIKSMITVYSGAAAFLIGHIFYMVAFTRTATSLIDRYSYGRQYSFFNKTELIALVLLCAAALLLLKPVLHFDFDNVFMKIGVFIYGMLLIFMLVKAISFALIFYSFSMENNISGSVILMAGSVLFFISDLTLGLRLLGGKRDSRAVLTTSVFTYFSAQTLFALSILYIR